MQSRVAAAFQYILPRTALEGAVTKYSSYQKLRYSFGGGSSLARAVAENGGKERLWRLISGRSLTRSRTNCRDK